MCIHLCLKGALFFCADFRHPHHRMLPPNMPSDQASYGTEQAMSVAVSWARGRLGRVVFREAAVMADVASDMAYLGRVGWNQQPPSCPFRSAAGL